MRQPKPEPVDAEWLARHTQAQADYRRTVSDAPERVDVAPPDEDFEWLDS